MLKPASKQQANKEKYGKKENKTARCRFYEIMTNCLENAENTVNVLSVPTNRHGQEAGQRSTNPRSAGNKKNRIEKNELMLPLLTNVAYEQCLLMKMMKQHKNMPRGGTTECKYNEL